MVLGSGPGYFKLQPGGPAGSRGRVLVVAFGSAPGVPNWGGLLAKVIIVHTLQLGVDIVRL